MGLDNRMDLIRLFEDAQLLRSVQVDAAVVQAVDAGAALLGDFHADAARLACAGELSSHCGNLGFQCFVLLRKVGEDCHGAWSLVAPRCCDGPRMSPNCGANKAAGATNRRKDSECNAQWPRPAPAPGQSSQTFTTILPYQSLISLSSVPGWLVGDATSRIPPVPCLPAL